MPRRPVIFATQYDRLLAPCLFVRLWHCASWLLGSVYRAKSCTSVLLGGLTIRLLSRHPRFRFRTKTVLIYSFIHSFLTEGSYLCHLSPRVTVLSQSLDLSQMNEWKKCQFELSVIWSQKVGACARVCSTVPKCNDLKRQYKTSKAEQDGKNIKRQQKLTK